VHCSYFEGYQKNLCGRDCCERFQAFAGLYWHPSGCLGSIVWFATILGQHFSTIVRHQDCTDVAKLGQSGGNGAASALWIRNQYILPNYPEKWRSQANATYVDLNCTDLDFNGLNKQEAHTWFLISIAVVTPRTASIKWS